MSLHGRINVSTRVSERVTQSSSTIPQAAMSSMALTDADKQAVLAMFDRKVSGGETAVCRQPHTFNVAKADIARNKFCSKHRS